MSRVSLALALSSGSFFFSCITALVVLYVGGRCGVDEKFEKKQMSVKRERERDVKD